MRDIRELLRTTHVCEDMAGAALALIREQDAELVRLRAEHERLRAFIEDMGASYSLPDHESGGVRWTVESGVEVQP